MSSYWLPFCAYQHDGCSCGLSSFSHILLSTKGTLDDDIASFAGDPSSQLDLLCGRLALHFLIVLKVTVIYMLDAKHEFV